MIKKLKTALGWAAVVALIPAFALGSLWLGDIRCRLIAADALRSGYDLPQDIDVRMRRSRTLRSPRPTVGRDWKRVELWCGGVGPDRIPAAARLDVTWPFAINGEVEHIAIAGRQLDDTARDLLARCASASA